MGMARAFWCGMPVYEVCRRGVIHGDASWLGKRIDVLLGLDAWTLEVGEDEIVIVFNERLDKLPMD